MAEENKNRDKNKVSVFSNIVDALNTNRRKKSTINQQSPGMGVTQSMPSLDPRGGVEQMQQQYLDWQVQKISHDLYTRTIYYDTDRISAYQDFRAMDGTPEIAAALNIIRDECLVRSERGNILEVYSENKRVKQILEDLFKNVLNVNFNMRLWIRDLVKYGDYFVLLQVDKEVGIYDFLTLPMEEMHREEGYDGRTSSTRFRWETTGDYFEEWQVAHFRLLEDSRKLPYGRSLLDSSRKLWKQLQLAEDAMLVYRLVRAPERRIFFIEVGNLPDTDVKTYMQKVQNQIRKQPMVDTKTGNVTQKYDPENVTEDYWIPVRGDKSSKIETLPGACLALNTKIDLLDGRNLELSEIIKEFEKGKKLWSYSINPKSGEIIPGKITWAGITRKNADVIKLTLDNGESIICTPDHKFPSKFNGIIEAKDLKAGESLWSFNKQFKSVGKNINKKNNNYEMIYSHDLNKFVYTHRMVANYFKKINEQDYFVYDEKYLESNKETVHHKNFNRYDNSPENLLFMNNEDHRFYHASLVENFSKQGGEATKQKYENDSIFKQNVDSKLKKARDEYYLNRNDEKTISHNNLISKGLKKYFINAPQEELDRRIKILADNAKKGSEKLQELLSSEVYKKEFYEKTSKSLKIVKNTFENKKKQSEIAKQQWNDVDFRNAVIEKQTIKYSEKMLNFIVDRLKNNLSTKEILADINKFDSLFITEFSFLNKDNKQLLKMKNGFTHNNLSKMMMHFGYSNWKDFKNKIEFFNHKIVSIEFLNEKQDTGTITIDGNEKYHNYHNFSLSCGVFTQNSNLGDIQDIEYLQNKLFAALQVPKTYLNYAESMPGGSTLSQADIRFSRTVNSIQEAVLMELRRVANVHLVLLGFEDDLENFQLTLTNPSTQQELLKLETMKARLEVFKEFFNTEATAPASYTWAMENILGFSKSDIKLMLKQKKVEKKIFAEIDSAVETYKKIGLFDELDERYEDPEAAAGAGVAGGGEAGGEEGGDTGGGGGGGSFGGGMDMGAIGGAPEAGGAEAGAEAGGAEAGAEETPLAESKIVKFMKKSDRRMDNFINELLGPDENIIKLMREKQLQEDNVLVKKNKVVNAKTKQLLESIEKSINSVTIPGQKIILEVNQTEEEGSNILFERNQENNEKTKEAFEKLDEIINLQEDNGQL